MLLKTDMKNVCFMLLLFAVFSASAQSVDELKDAYSGKLKWNKKNGNLTFETSGKIFFTKEDSVLNYYWMVPEDVKKILINSDTRVIGAFHTFADCTIEGKDRKTSVIYGSPEQRWANNRSEIRAYNYSHILGHAGILTLKNLTMLDPFSFFVRVPSSPAHISNCDFLDYRGGHGNHSDGVGAGDGTTIDNCYFATGDDAIKVYNDMTVTNCTIEMVQNCVPIQLGWGNYSDGAVGTFKNLKIIGDSGRGSSDNAIISGRRGSYTVTINIDGLEVENPNAVMVSLWDETMTLNGEIKNAKITVKQFSNRRTAGQNNLIICGTDDQLSSYDCRE